MLKLERLDQETLMPVLTAPPKPATPTRQTPAAVPGKGSSSRGAKAKAGPRPKWLDDPEVRLMLDVQEGDTAAFDQLQERYRPRVFGYFCRQLGDRMEAEDLTQEVFLRLYRSRDRYQPRARFATWVFHITQNVARNALRSRRRHPFVRLDPLTHETKNLLEVLLTDSQDAPSRPLEREEVAGMVRKAVAGLAGRQRMALELHQFCDLTYAEVAAELDMTPKAAKSLLYRARNQLRANLISFMSC
jgi:RNA polymerase sigma-70 factor (ECF subfamily)